MNISEIVIKHREKKGWTQRELAQHSGVCERTIQRAEDDKNTISTMTQRKLAEALGIEFEDFLDSSQKRMLQEKRKTYILEIYFNGECIEQQRSFDPFISPLPGEQIYIEFKNKNYSEEYGNWWSVEKRQHLKFDEEIFIETLMLTCVPDLRKGEP